MKCDSVCVKWGQEVYHFIEVSHI